MGAVAVGYKCHCSWHLPSGRQWLGAGWAPWRGCGVPPLLLMHGHRAFASVAVYGVGSHSSYNSLTYIQPHEDPPPPHTKVTIVGKNEIYKRKNPIGHFWYTNFWVPDPPHPLFSSNVSLSCHLSPFQPRQDPAMTQYHR